MTNTEYLVEHYGLLIGGRDLIRMLGYKSSGAFYKAIRESRVVVEIFEIHGRQGKFAMTRDVGEWLDRIDPQQLKEGEKIME